ncbi:MAG TPA: bifunctional YncE family protein/alkaline phosphatase family protein [Frankiaceae bacterium]|nr:bifunctional YncE family protein/alkaline phosphatase family protein [Frankiaceae bacterium]
MRPGARRAVAALACAAALAAALGVDAAPADRRVGRRPDGSVVLPTNQEIHPAGVQVEFPGRANAVAIRPDGRTATVLTDKDTALTVVDLAAGTVLQRLDPEQGLAAYTGIVYAPDGRKLYASTKRGVVVAGVAPDGTLTFAGLVATRSTPGGLALSRDGRLLYATLTEENALAVINPATRKVRTTVAVGNAPHSVVIAGAYAVVSNRGGRRARPGDPTNISAGTAIVADRSSGAATTGTVSLVSLRALRTVASVRVGLSPAGMAVRGTRVFVANANSDTVSVVDVRRRALEANLPVRPFAGAPFGSSPNAVAVLDSRRIAVTLGRNNAVAVLRWHRRGAPAVVEGLLPTGWYPSDVVVEPLGRRLVVANDKGVGAVTSDASQALVGIGAGGVNVKDTRGSLSVMPWPTPEALTAGTAAVRTANHWDTLPRPQKPNPSAPPKAVPYVAGEPSLIKHVFLVIKENRTYDQLLGDDPRGNGDPTKVHFGANVSPNHHKLATEYPLLDNFYVNGSVSADGHQWLVQSFVTDYLEESYGDWSRGYPYDGGDALAYAPTPFLWEHAKRYGRTVKVYGEFANATDKSGTRSDIPSLDRVLVRKYPRFDLRIRDSVRADVFAAEFAKQVATNTVPNLSIIQLPMDHTHGLKPGAPDPRGDVADNDLAFGRIVETISKSPIWDKSAVFAVEDDAQSGLDHVDGHRTAAFVVSPYARRGLVDSTYYTQVDMVRTIEQILGLPPMNQVDLLATPMRNVFTDNPMTTEYDPVQPVVPPAVNPPLSALSGLPLLWAKACDEIDFSVPDSAPDQLLNRAIWYGVHGFVPYPGDPRVLTPDEALALEVDED